MIGDEGSGYWIGRESLAAVMRASDGRGPETRLTSEILTHFAVSHESRLPRLVYDRELPRVSVAALGPITQRVAEQGDAVAVGILERAADELVLAARSVATRLAMRGDAITFYLAGGVFHVVPWLADELPGRLVEVAPRAQTRMLHDEPAVGAVWLALAEARGGARVPQYQGAGIGDQGAGIGEQGSGIGDRGSGLSARG
jgi:N-acetylglucosamine kinase-like BadF-type ATPase